MACFTGPLAEGAEGLKPCANNPLFGAENGYAQILELEAFTFNVFMSATYSY